MHLFPIQAIQKGNMDGARIHAENSIRQKNQVMYDSRSMACLTAICINGHYSTNSVCVKSDTQVLITDQGLYVSQVPF